VTWDEGSAQREWRHLGTYRGSARREWRRLDTHQGSAQREWRHLSAQPDIVRRDRGRIEAVRAGGGAGAVVRRWH